MPDEQMGEENQKWLENIQPVWTRQSRGYSKADHGLGQI